MGVGNNRGNQEIAFERGLNAFGMRILKNGEYRVEGIYKFSGPHLGHLAIQ